MWYLYNSALGIRASVSISGSFRGINGGEEIQISDKDLQDAQLVCQHNPMLKLGRTSFLGDVSKATDKATDKHTVSVESSTPEVIGYIDPLTSDLLEISKVPVYGLKGKISDLTVAYNPANNSVIVMSDKHQLKLVTKNTDGVEEESGTSEVLDFITDVADIEAPADPTEVKEEGLPVKKGAKAIIDSLKRSNKEKSNKKE